MKDRLSWFYELINISTKFYTNTRQKLENIPWPYMLFAAGAVLRISGFTVGSIWYDEMFSLQITRQGFWEMIQSLKLNISPPGFEIILWFITRVFGWNEFSLRLPSVISSIITLWIVYRVTVKLQFTPEQKNATLALAAFLPYQLVAAQQGRVYAIFALLYMIGFYASISRNWILLGFSMGGMLWCHNISYFFIPGLLVIAFQIYPGDWKKILATVLIAFTIYLPWINESLKQAIQPMPWFASLALRPFVGHFYTAFFGWGIPDDFRWVIINWLVILCFFAAFQPILSWCLRNLRTLPKGLFVAIRRQTSLFNLRSDISVVDWLDNNSHISHILFLAFMVPFVFLLVTSLFFKNIILYRTLYPLIIPFVMYLVHYFVILQPNIVHRFIWFVSAVIITVGLFFLSPIEGGIGISNLEQTVRDNFQSGDAFYHNTGFTALVFKYYFPDYPHYLIDGDETWGLTDLQATKTDIRKFAPEQVPAQRLWVVWMHSLELASMNKVSDERVQRLVANCAIMGSLDYTQSWDVKIFLCKLK